MRIRTIGALLTSLLLVSCFQAQLHGPVSGALIEVAPLRDPGSVQLTVDAESRASLIDSIGEDEWQALGAAQLWMLGVFRLDTSTLDADTLYLVTARGGADADANSDGLPDTEYSEVQGSWHAIMSGRQLQSLGPKVSALTEAAYQWLADDIGQLSDRQLSYNLALAAAQLVSNTDAEAAVDNDDLLAWSRQFHVADLQVQVADVDALAASVAAGESESARREMARQLVGLEVYRGVPPGLDPAATLDEQLRGLDIDSFFERSYEALLLRYPEWVVELGLESAYPDMPVSLDNASDAYERETFDVVRVILDRLQDYDVATLPAEQQSSVEVYQWYLEDWLGREPWLLYSYPASSFIDSVPRETEFFFSDIQPLETEQDARNYLTRLRYVGEKIEQARQAVLARAEVGIIEPAITLDVAAGALRFTARTRATSTAYYKRFTAALGSLNLSVETQLGMRTEAQHIIEEQLQPAYEALRQTLLDLLNEAPEAIGVGQFPRGRDYYAYALKHFTTTDQTAAEIHQTGLAEVSRVTADIRQAASRLGYSNSVSLQDLFLQLREEGGLLPANETLPAYTDILDDAWQNARLLFNRLPQQELVVLGGSRGGFYLPGAEDGSRPGAFYAQTASAEPYYSMPSLAYHEGVPGHHLQIALARELDIPDFRRRTNYAGFSEGWALYAERLAAEQGWYEDDSYGDLGRLQFELVRAARLVVDTGIHEYGWGWDEAVDYYATTVGTSSGAAQGAVARFLRWPGQAAAYMTGMNVILDLRRRYAEQQGASYDIRNFHSLVLEGGSMPLELLESRVLSAN